MHPSCHPLQAQPSTSRSGRTVLKDATQCYVMSHEFVQFVQVRKALLSFSKNRFCVPMEYSSPSEAEWTCSLADSLTVEVSSSSLFILEVGDCSWEQGLGGPYLRDWPLQWRCNNFRVWHGNSHLWLRTILCRGCIWWRYQHQMGHMLWGKGWKERDIPVAPTKRCDQNQDEAMEQCQQRHSQVWFVLLNGWCHLFLCVDGRFG